MDSAAAKVEIAEEELLEPLIITEDGDISQAVPDGEATTGGREEEPALGEKEEPSGEDQNKEAAESEMYLGEQRWGQNTEDKGQDISESEEKSHEEVIKENPSEAEEETVVQEEERVEIRRLNSSKQQPNGAEKQVEDATKAHRLTPDFPEALFDLLCTFQEGRRLNDQRCSFRLEEGMRRRRCHSEPNTRKPANRVVFSSMTSLQKEEFFDLVATAQARRLDDQRAQLGRSAPSKAKSRSLRGSLRQLSIVRKPDPAPAPPAPVPKEELYNMILTTQAQGRLEDQRSRAPGPMDDEDFFSLLLRVQGGRMDEQRTELPCLLQI
ncbi:G-protein-signaling modulator 1 [Austrofundulus limnaeus]|uniref:G-protein-signaling modulator 1-like n=1 Tax=Austrofundulus limnaeus TaxID=52670 RepID=A0A2I4BVP3_AUSLI|nr:PREDICTED: G-protein-signaling modulator 1-like [Austrofundulus limnaeus]XP_013871820.1 PREDICTED: G-protein-signaling modulator 1-like [Austrofundulus limnaeus]XP_013871821.1 PREDICTED: G-protein-signaling modulator 1-like [Austrofundulus limnaeus]XP_013871822.1 PREDICTED: G-protein-signaling modulator 1-like [Austrofundulus limnaeus]XP_013871823.1 PREDICTED: G-protein-signaling modulator 1-like [Austrofundulus limnaeus]XP_013871825.1 PREDICTED: G-protein-signaling modulator 1-like [Austro